MLDLSKQSNQSWINEYMAHDEMWLNQSLNQEQISPEVLVDRSINNLLFNPLYYNTYISIDGKTNLSFLDAAILGLNRIDSTLSTVKTEMLLTSFFLDVANSANVMCLNMLWNLKSNNADLRSPLMMYHSEVYLSFDDVYVICFRDSTLYHSVNAVFGSYISAISSMIPISNSSGGVSVFTLYALTFALLILSSWATEWATLNHPNFLRVLGYTSSTALKTRIRLDSALVTVFLFLFYWLMTLATFDDDEEDVIELFNASWFYFFNLIVLYLCYKHSSNYFSFLGQSVKGGRSIAFLTKQFSKDLLGSFSIFLRFYILLFRIQVYDTLDDFFDSYYIFLGDFDDLEDLTQLFFSLEDQTDFYLDNNTDSEVFMNAESSISGDAFHIYFVLWGQLFYFLALIVEEAARLSLAFYVCYLIIFEVQSVNCSYKENTYLEGKL